MPFKETEEGQTQYCVKCELDANKQPSTRKHTCGKEDKAQPEWMEKFDKQFPVREIKTNGGNHLGHYTETPYSIKLFIQQTLEQDRKTRLADLIDFDWDICESCKNELNKNKPL